MIFGVLAAVAFGGGIGAVLRHLAGVWVSASGAGNLPLATYLVNVLGSTLFGAVAGLAARRRVPVPLRSFLTAGLCGGLTTFSAFELELVELLRQGRPLVAGGYMLVSVVTCLAGVWVGLSLTRGTVGAR